jgi:hypothetical protein
MKYKIGAILWQDHLKVDRNDIPDDPDEAIEVLLRPTLSVGMIMRETEKSVLLVFDIERYGDHDEGTYLIILRPNILGITTYGEIELEDIRFSAP